jgi:multiple antibiotic resistance protein
MPEVASVAFYSFVTLLAMVNPIEAAGAFASLTGDKTPQQRNAIALRATLLAAGILVGFALIGDALLRALGISIEAFQIAGGLLLLRVAFNMVFAKETDNDTADDVKSHPQPSSDPSVFPLAIPIITGPGALTAIVTIVANGRTHPLIAYPTIVVIIAAVFGLTYLAMRASGMLSAFLGRTGIDATSRVVGIIVAAIAVQLVIDGATEMSHSIVH